MSDQLTEIVQDIAARFGALPQVEAVALAGSQAAGRAGPKSDLDIYVYTQSEIPVVVRASIITPRAQRAEINNQYWETGDEWIETNTQIAVDLMFRSPAWIEDQLDRVLTRHEASVGYSTCFWYNVRESQVFYDRNDWFHKLQERAKQPYPEPLRRAVIAKNYPILRDAISSYLHQLEKAVSRGDLVSVNHRVAALLASYFDILFAVNRVLHPGEKRLIEIATAQCAKIPVHMSEQVQDLLCSCTTGDQQVTERADALLDGLAQLLRAEGLIAAQ